MKIKAEVIHLEQDYRRRYYVALRVQDEEVYLYITKSQAQRFKIGQIVTITIN